MACPQGTLLFKKGPGYVNSVMEGKCLRIQRKQTDSTRREEENASHKALQKYTLAFQAKIPRSSIVEVLPYPGKESHVQTQEYSREQCMFRNIK